MTDKIQNFRLTPDDDKLIVEIQKGYGLTTKVAAIRLSLTLVAAHLKKINTLQK